MRIGVDLMGGDTAPQVLFEALLKAEKLIGPKSAFVAFATKEIQQQLILKSTTKIDWCIAEDFISMADDPLVALRQKKKSTIALGIKFLRKHVINAFISSGNTGALIANATLYLPKFSKNTRPALLAFLPTQKGSVAVLDVGGNVSSKAEHLVQFAKMGAFYQSKRLNGNIPKVGLLNIGAESKKGSLEIRQAYEMLMQENSPDMHFIGNVEGCDVFSGKVDVLVTTGMAGNVLLKTAEGMAAFIFDSLSKENLHLSAHLEQKFNYAEYPGAIVAGVDGLVIKCHGYAPSQALYTSIKGAIALLSS